MSRTDIGGKPIAIGNVWLLKSGCRGEHASDFRKYAFQCKFSGEFFLHSEEQGFFQLCHFGELASVGMLDFGSQGVGLQLRFSAAHEPPNSVVRLSFNDQNLHEMFIEYLEKRMSGSLVADFDIL